MKKILITNDDGINSDGIQRLAEAAKVYGEVWVVAPESQRSAMSHSITLRTTVEVWPVDFPVEGVHAYACNGTPADCVRIGALNIVPGKPDHVFSGINFGYNIATDVQYSATAGAAFEASFQGIHVIAFSEGMVCHETTDEYLSSIMGTLLTKPLDYGEIWNVNFPECFLKECGGIKWDCTISRDVVFRDHYEKTRLEDGKLSFKVVGVREYSAKEGTDFDAILNNYVSVGKVKNIH